MSGNESVVSGVRDVSWESGDSLLHDWVFFNEKIVESALVRRMRREKNGSIINSTRNTSETQRNTTWVRAKANIAAIFDTQAKSIDSQSSVKKCVFLGIAGGSLSYPW